MKRSMTILTSIAIGTALVIAGSATAHNKRRAESYEARLSGFQEDPQAISTSGNGRIRVTVDEDRGEITYSLNYADLEGTVTQAHIHIGERHQSGGISVFLCSNLGNGPAGTQACPAAPARVTGTLRAADVIGPVPQGIDPGQFDELVNAIRAGAAYANVHTTLRPAGEIRGQLHKD